MMHEGQHDQAIEDVLHALRTTGPPQGYETRIHNALLQANAEPQSSFTLGNRHARRSTSLINRHPERSAAKSKDLLSSLLPKMSWAATCAVLLIVGMAVRSYTHHDAPRNTPAIAHANTPSPQPTSIAIDIPAPTIRQQAKRTTPKQGQHAEPQRIEVALQTHEYIPEPPMPLTEQERLVLRMTRHNDSQQLAEYTPDARARQLHEDAQAYHDYFAEKPLDGQPIYHQKISGGNQ